MFLWIKKYVDYFDCYKNPPWENINQILELDFFEPSMKSYWALRDLMIYQEYCHILSQRKFAGGTNLHVLVQNGIENM